MTNVTHLPYRSGVEDGRSRTSWNLVRRYWKTAASIAAAALLVAALDQVPRSRISTSDYCRTCGAKRTRVRTEFAGITLRDSTSESAAARGYEDLFGGGHAHHDWIKAGASEEFGSGLAYRGVACGGRYPREEMDRVRDSLDCLEWELRRLPLGRRRMLYEEFIACKSDAQFRAAMEAARAEAKRMPRQ